jgi:hypothetical protein
VDIFIADLHEDGAGTVRISRATVKRSRR